MKILSFSLSLCIVTLSLVAQADSDQSVLAKKKALLFQVSNNFNLQSAEGSFLSFKKMLSTNSAFRIGVTLNGAHTEGEALYLPDSTFVVSDDDRSELNLGVSFLYQRYLNSTDALKFYYAYGFRAFLFHSWSNPINYSYGDELRIGPGGVVGVEWFFHKSMSLSAEYGSFLYYSYRQEKYDMGDQGKFTLRDHTIGLTQDQVRIGLSAFF